MKPTRTCIVTLLAFRMLACNEGATADHGWEPLFDGKTLAGWKVGDNPTSFRVQDGAILLDGPRAHLFYCGKVNGGDFKNFELALDVRTDPGANSGVYYHTEFQTSGFPKKGREIQINNTYTAHGNYYEHKKTGSLYGVRNQFLSVAKDHEWFPVRVIVRGRRVQVYVNDTLVTDYMQPGGGPSGHGTFALQCHDPHSKVRYRNIRVKPLPDEAHTSSPPVLDAVDRKIAAVHRTNFPLVDLHVHLKGGLTLDEALTHARKNGFNYGIAPNCGLGFPITDDAGIYKFVETMKGKPIFLGMQAEGREWVDIFSKEAISKFDYVFTDAMTFTDHRGKRVRLWMDDEVEIGDKQKFMDMLVDRIVGVMGEPIDVYVNSTFLPKAIADEYDELWTKPRMQRVIDAAVKNNVAIEINARYKIPSAKFIKMAKKAGAKFTFGTNNVTKELGRMEYCLDMIEECGLKPNDMFLPNKPIAKKP